MTTLDKLLLEGAANVLQIPAKADLILGEVRDSLKKRDARRPNEEGLVRCKLPSAFKDAAYEAMGLAFKEKAYREGLSIAWSYGLMEDLQAKIEAIPFPLHPSHQTYTNRVPSVPHEIQQLPGYTPPRQYHPEDHHSIIRQAAELTGQFIHHYLLPQKKFHTAAEQLIKIGERHEAIHVATGNVSLETLAELCKKAQTGFSSGIHIAEQTHRPDLATQLKEAHITSLRKGTNFDFGKRAGRWREAADLAISYWQSSEKSLEIIREGFNALLGEFSRMLGEWDSEKVASERRFYGMSYGMSCESEHTITQRLERQRQLNTARTDHIRSPRSDTGRELITLIQSLPTEEVAAAKDRIYQSCSLSSFDGMGFALQWGDFHRAVGYGLHIIKMSKRDCYLHHCASQVHSLIEEELLSKVDDGDRKNYLSVLMLNEDWDRSRKIAKQYGLGEWLMGQYASTRKPWVAAKIAVELGKNEEAKNFFIQAEQFDQALAFTESPLEKVALHFSLARARVEDRTRYESSAGNFKPEVEQMRKGLDLLSANQTEPSKGRYIDEGLLLVGDLIKAGNYSEALLFAQEAHLPKDKYGSLIADTALTNSERERDYAACYHVAMLLGNSSAVNIYRTLAKSAKQPIPTKIDDFLEVSKSAHLDLSGEADF